MKPAKALQLQNSMASSLRSIYSAAIGCQFTSEFLRTQVRYIFESVKAKGAPRYVVAYLNGLNDHLNYDLNLNHIVFGYRYKGKFYTTKAQIDKLINIANKTAKPSEHECWKNPQHVYKSDNNKLFF